MTTKLVDRAVGYNANTRYIQPSMPLSDNIISHAIPTQTWCNIFEYFRSRLKLESIRPTLVTKYHDSAQVLTVETYSRAGKVNTNKQLEAVFQVDRIPCDRSSGDRDHADRELPDPSQHISWEFVAENRFELALSRFPLSYDYDHTRQALQWKLEAEGGFKVVMELLIEGLRSYDDLKSVLSHEMSQVARHELVFSRSFRIYLDEKAKANRRNLVEILSEHLENINKIICV